MGIALWLACAAVVFFAARGTRFARDAKWVIELLAATISAMAFGVLATALDFGGWNELDWRAALFVFFGTPAIVGSIRLLRMLIAPTPHPLLPAPPSK